MSWKGVELQVALPRTQDAGQLQDQLNQRGQFSQDHFAQSQLKEADLKRKKVLETNEEEKITNEEDESKNEQIYSSKHQSQSPLEYKEQHPYLGKIIDYSG
ncbi:hypothetical protein E3U55_05045 [Filobacillus milosensis]|uniref:RNA polymerase subunit sigma n=1 Tax=Filobacillus milosensis TaxID=94137 RepID=A0A4Y8IVB7_9BACI|nr:hypothetical protein [Filobacillus milosensis]TFB23186.1 hypothetical protein E3U55_05045 [Filobacillus milosensis]